jgi:hypothetical protein
MLSSRVVFYTSPTKFHISAITASTKFAHRDSRIDVASGFVAIWDEKNFRVISIRLIAMTFDVTNANTWAMVTTVYTIVGLVATHPPEHSLRKFFHTGIGSKQAPNCYKQHWAKSRCSASNTCDFHRCMGILLDKFFWKMN